MQSLGKSLNSNQKKGRKQKMNERRATYDDLSGILTVIKDAQEYLRYQGIDQWQDGFPNETTILEDIRNHISFVYVEEDQIIGYMALNLGVEVSYHKIYDGKFRCNTHSYLTIHRTAITQSHRGRGLSSKMFQLAQQIAVDNGMESIRIDTHRDNKLMQHLAMKHGFEYCGVILLQRSNSERFVYERVL